MRFIKYIKVAIRDNDISNLQSILNEISTTNNTNNIISTETLYRIRTIFGEIIEHLNYLSSLYNSGMRGGRISDELQKSNLINDIKNIDTLHNLSRQINEKVQSLTIKDTNISNLIKIINKLSKYIEFSNFTQKQISDITNLLSENITRERMLPQTTNERRQRAFLTSFYSTAQGPQRTLKVLREILQNSCDAIRKTGKENGAIKVFTHNHKYGTETMDMIVEDNGVGMDWETLSKKFFVYFETGKEDSAESTGGYGIAKALIQETPKEGWSIETGDIYSNRFHKSMYEGDIDYQPKKLDIKVDGAILSLYNIPYTYEYEMRSLIGKYISMSNIKFYLNGIEIKPEFTKENVIFFNSSNELANTISEKPSEREIIYKNLTIANEGDLFSGTFKVKETETSFKLAIRKLKNEQAGFLYLFLNGQYQSHQYKYGALMGIDLICFIETTARPTTEEYPIDPARENIKEPYKSQISTIIDATINVISESKETELLKEGLDVKIVNSENDFLRIRRRSFDSEENRMVSELSNDVSSTLWGNYDEETKKRLLLEKLKRQMMQEGKLLSETQENTIRREIDSLVDSNETDSENINKAIDNIYRSINVKLGVIIQREYIGSITEETHEKLMPLAIIWQKSLEILGEKILASPFSKDFTPNTNIVPGVIFSKDALGLTMRENKNRNYNLILINPLSIASSLWPQDFRALLETVDENTISGVSKEQEETPIKKITSIILHTGIHELGHLCVTYDSGFETFHKIITFLEMICDNEQTRRQIYDVVKENMPKLKPEFKKLITEIKRQKKNKVSFNLRKRNIK